MFSQFAAWMSQFLGNAKIFFTALVLIAIWFVAGFLFGFSDAWQLSVNTGTTIVTFLMVLLLQHTQNRDTVAIQLKLDEIIRSLEGAQDDLLKIEQLSDDDLETIHRRYQHLAQQVKDQIGKGKPDIGYKDEMQA